MSELNPRLHAFRPDLADKTLEGRVEADRYVTPTAARIGVPVADLKRDPRRDSMTDTQLLFGEPVLVFETGGEGWSWVQSAGDDYVGYVESEALITDMTTPTHVVSALRSYVYPGPELKAPPARCLSMGSLVAITSQEERRGTEYAVFENGEAMIASHLRPMGEMESDAVTVAERFEHTPYLWGGRSGFGLDCSALVQFAFAATGRRVLRDTDMQATSIGTELAGGWEGIPLQRGDLVFWNGHVALMRDAETLIHANGHTMTVFIEPLNEAVNRIARLYGEPTIIRRP